MKGFYGRPVSWSKDGDLLTRTGDNVLSRLRFNGDQWEEMSHLQIPMARGQFKTAELASNGTVVIGDYETPSIPPSLIVYNSNDLSSKRLIAINPQLEGATLAPYREIEWDTSSGFHASGYLFFPPNYDSRKRYPLVIHAYPAASNFFCDSGFNHMPSFAPQPLANAGIMYLIRIYTNGSELNEERQHFPSGYPGQLSEAAFQMDVYDSAVDKLASEGLVDPQKVGIIGFSRSGWYTEFALTHGRTHYAAATLADNVEYSLGEYWILHTKGTFTTYDAMFGGPPYGDSLKNWLDHSISFNIQKIQAPILMEVMGYGTKYTDSNTAPSGIVEKEEVFTGLMRLGKPVELYYYPLEMHQPDDPLARLSSLTRNVDWYRYWLQGYEKPNPEDPDQYKRWDRMRELRDAGAMATAAAR
jgi:dipeptidyl aminopeptidase/acylaminoacyl peptidase